MDYTPPSNPLLHTVWTKTVTVQLRGWIFGQDANSSAAFPPNKNGNSSVSKLILFWHNVFVVKLKFWISRKVSVPTANLWTSRLWGCTHLESTLAPTTTAPGVGIPNQRLEKGAGTGWWCWRQATNFQTMSVVTPAWALSSLAWANQVETFLATGMYHRWFYEPGCNNGAVHILDSRNSNIVRILKHNILMQKVDFFLHQTHLQWQARQPKLPMLLYKLLSFMKSMKRKDAVHWVPDICWWDFRNGWCWCCSLTC